MLLVEDMAGDARLTQEALRGSREAPAAFHVTHVRTLHAALAMLQEGGFDAVLLDLTLPDSSGIPTVEAAVEACASRGLPVVVLTGLGDDPEFGVRALQAGAEDFVDKGGIDGAVLSRSLLFAVERAHRRIEEAEARRRAEELGRLREEAEARTRLFRAVAHNLNTPLTPMRLQLHILLQEHNGPLTDRQRRSIALLERNTARLSELVHQVLDLVRLEHGRLPLDVVPVDLAVLARDAMDTFETIAQQRGIRLEARLPDAMPAEVDASRVTQVLANLLSNALRLTPRGGEVVVAGGPAAEDGQAWLLQVADTGPGLTEAQLAALFEPFSQPHESLSGQEPGLGLGLTISRGMVEAHGGSLRCASDGPGEGATFLLTLPAKAHVTEPAALLPRKGSS